VCYAADVQRNTNAMVRAGVDVRANVELLEGTLNGGGKEGVGGSILELDNAV